jgi:Peptidase propeptide and YPEB domain
MKINYLLVFPLALSLTTGCVEVKTRCCCCGAKHEQKEEEEESEEHEEKHKDKHKEKEESEEREEHEEREGKEHDSKADLMKKAKLTEADARKIAMERVPNGTIKEGELEMEKGHLQWSFDMSTPDSKDTTEVNVDAISGQVLNVAKEKAEDEAKEQEKEGKEHEKDKD